MALILFDSGRIDKTNAIKNAPGRTRTGSSVGTLVGEAETIP